MQAYRNVFFTRPDPVLAEGAVHIWHGFLDRPIPETNLLAQSLSAEERRRAARFRFDCDRDRYIARHALLRIILGRYAGIEPRAVRFEQGTQGKPAMRAPGAGRSVRFSLSHTNGYAVLVFSRTSELGVDIELVRDISDMEQIVERFFSPRDKELFHGLPSAKRKDAFFGWWTRMEALAKATGAGLALQLNTHSAASCSPQLDAWSVHSLQLVPGFAGAVAVEKEHGSLICYAWEASGGCSAAGTGQDRENSGRSKGEHTA